MKCFRANQREKVLLARYSRVRERERESLKLERSIIGQNVKNIKLWHQFELIFFIYEFSYEKNEVEVEVVRRVDTNDFFSTIVCVLCVVYLPFCAHFVLLRSYYKVLHL